MSKTDMPLFMFKPSSQGNSCTDPIEVNTCSTRQLSAKNTLAMGLQTVLKTVGLASLGTLALVGSHHLGRKQSNPDARLRDYIEGLGSALQRAQHHVQNNTTTKPHQQTHFTHQPPHFTNQPQPQFATPSNAGITSSIGDRLQTAHWISGVADLKNNTFAVVAIDSQRQIIWQTPMPERVHDILIQPLSMSYDKPQTTATHHAYKSDVQVGSPQVVVMGRRPSDSFWVLDSLSGEVIYHIKSEPNRHFYGHACYSLAGDLLYVTENNTSDFRGMIGVYDVAAGYKKIDEFATHGIGPHELVMHTDGETLVVANGGIKTERASRQELNLESMQPSLVYLDRHNGTLLQQVYPEHNQMSVRHLAMHDNGTVVVGIQFQGERHLSVPLILTHRRGESKLSAMQLDKADTKGWHRFHHYIASVAVDSDHNLVCVTSPIGGCAAIFDLTTGKMIDATELADCAGVANWANAKQGSIPSENDVARFLVSDGQGYLTQLSLNQMHPSKLDVNKLHQPYAFDNHLNALVKYVA